MVRPTKDCRLIFAKPYCWYEGDPLRNTAILDAAADKPEFFLYPYTPEERRQIIGGMLVDPGNIAYEAWRDKEFLGIILLSRVIPHVDALLHFLFVDKDLVGKRKLLKNFLNLCFTEMGFHRISMEVPEGVRLERFARKVLGFQYEGESRPRNSELPKSLTDNWVAKQGSRREGAVFTGTEWKDVLLLRLLASEWVGEEKREAECPLEQFSELQHPPSEDSSEKP